MNLPSFFGKILLFGEYGIIENAKGLTVPYKFYEGSLKFSDSKEHKNSHESLVSFYNFLATELPELLNYKKFKEDLDNGMYFESSIPQGYGVGSSGALVAAIYDLYAVNRLSRENLNEKKIQQLKDVFSAMESYFHGKSSGIDPLICYLNIPLLIRSKTDITTVGMPDLGEGKGAVFLINSGSPGKTEPMVQIFFEKLKNEGFRRTLHKEFTKYNDACIDAFVKGDTKPLFSNLKKLSRWAFDNFKPMIPNVLLNAWKNGIDSNDYYLKLCGSGGGGYVLGFTRDFEKAKKSLSDFELQLVYRF